MMKVHQKDKLRKGHNMKVRERVALQPEALPSASGTLTTFGSGPIEATAPYLSNTIIVPVPHRVLPDGVFHHIATR